MKTFFTGAGPALTFALILITAPSFAEDFHCPKPGTVIEFTEEGGKLTFASQDGMWCVGTGSSGQPWKRYAHVAGNSKFGQSLIDNHVEQIWPLQLGKQIEFKVPASTDNLTGGTASTGIPFWYTEKYTVVRQERVTVKAGTFDAWVIEHREDANRFIGTDTMWYAPEVGYIIKYNYHVAMGIGKDSAFEAKMISTPALTSVTPAPVATVAPSAPMAPTPAPVAKAAPPATPAPTPATPLASSVAERLQTLKDLLDRKVITPEEYTAKRKEILKSL